MLCSRSNLTPHGQCVRSIVALPINQSRQYHGLAETGRYRHDCQQICRSSGFRTGRPSLQLKPMTTLSTCCDLSAVCS